MFSKMIMVITVFAVSTATAGVSDTQISFETTACDGSIGFASVDLEKIWRFNSAGCTAPDKPDEPLLQVLVKSDTGVTNYEVYTVTPAEAESIQAQIKAHMEAKRKALEGGSTVIIDR